MPKFIMKIGGALALGLALLSVGLVAGHPLHDGNGSVRCERLPWLDGQSLVLTQGQFGCNPTHCVLNGLQYATDWDISGAPTFPIYAVAEGDALNVTGNCTKPPPYCGDGAVREGLVDPRIAERLSITLDGLTSRVAGHSMSPHREL